MYDSNDPNDPYAYLYYGGSDPNRSVGAGSSAPSGVGVPSGDFTGMPLPPGTLVPDLAEHPLDGSGGGGGGGGDNKMAEALKQIAAMKGGGGGNHVMNVLGPTATGAGIGTAFAPGIGTAIGAGAGLLIGLGGELFGGGPSEQEKIQVEQQRIALEELKKLAAWHNGGYADYMNSPEVAQSYADAQRYKGKT